MGFFAVLEHPQRGLMPVHSKGDLDYLLNRGWKKKEDEQKIVKSEIPEVKPEPKRRGRKPKART